MVRCEREFKKAKRGDWIEEPSEDAGEPAWAKEIECMKTRVEDAWFTNSNFRQYAGERGKLYREIVAVMARLKVLTPSLVKVSCADIVRYVGRVADLMEFIHGELQSNTLEALDNAAEANGVEELDVDYEWNKTKRVMYLKIVEAANMFGFNFRSYVDSERDPVMELKAERAISEMAARVNKAVKRIGVLVEINLPLRTININKA